MNAETVLQRLVRLFPGFRGYWERPENCFRADDGSFTLHGLLAEFSHYFREQYPSFSVDSVAELAAFLSDCMTPADTDLDNAVATCFLENIAGEDCGVTLERQMLALPTSQAPAPNPPKK